MAKKKQKPKKLSKKALAKQIALARQQAKMQAIAAVVPAYGSWLPPFSITVAGAVKTQKPRNLPQSAAERKVSNRLHKRLYQPSSKAGGGTKCPVCGAIVADRERHISPAMAAYLLLLYWWDKDHPNAYVRHNCLLAGYKDLLNMSGGGDIYKMFFWGLVEPMAKAANTIDPARGAYRITDRGRFFVRNVGVAARTLMFCRGHAIASHPTDLVMFESIIVRYKQQHKYPDDLLLPVCPNGPKLYDPYGDYAAVMNDPEDPWAEDQWETQAL